MNEISFLDVDVARFFVWKDKKPATYNLGSARVWYPAVGAQGRQILELKPLCEKSFGFWNFITPALIDRANKCLEPLSRFFVSHVHQSYSSVFVQKTEYYKFCFVLEGKR